MSNYEVNANLSEDDNKSIYLLNDYEMIGSIDFKVYPEKQKVWIYKIEVKEKYQSRGYGEELLKLFEDYCRKHRIFYVEGKFYPENDHARPFYIKHGYEIYKEYYSTYIYKDLREAEKTPQEDLTM